MRKHNCLIFERGRICNRIRLSADQNILLDKKAAEAFIRPPQPATEFSSMFFGMFPKRSTVYFLLRGSTDAYPLNTETARKRIVESEVWEMEDQLLNREKQKQQRGEQEPSHAKWLGATAALLALGVIALFALQVWTGQSI